MRTAECGLHIGGVLSFSPQS